MPFGLSCAPETFERYEKRISRFAVGRYNLVYLDDIIVTGTTFKNMLENLGKVFKRLKKVNLKLPKSVACLRKCHLVSLISRHNIGQGFSIKMQIH